MSITVEPITMCVDCALITANGVDDFDAEQVEHATNVMILLSEGTHAVVDEQIDDFSHRRCDLCLTTLAGARFSGALLTR